MHQTPVDLISSRIFFILRKKSESCSVLSNSLPPHGLYSPRNSPDQNTGVGSLSLLQGILPTQGSNPGFLRWGQILYQLSHKGSPGVLDSTGVLSLLPCIFPTQESNRGLLHCASLVAQLVKNLLAMRETWIRSLGWEDPLEKRKVTHSHILACRIPWTV